jgi:hypothetical protein
VWAHEQLVAAYEPPAPARPHPAVRRPPLRTFRKYLRSDAAFGADDARSLAQAIAGRGGDHEHLERCVVATAVAILLLIAATAWLELN